MSSNLLHNEHFNKTVRVGWLEYADVLPTSSCRQRGNSLARHVIASRSLRSTTLVDQCLHSVTTASVKALLLYRLSRPHQYTCTVFNLVTAKNRKGPLCSRAGCVELVQFRAKERLDMSSNSNGVKISSFQCLAAICFSREKCKKVGFPPYA